MLLELALLTTHLDGWHFCVVSGSPCRILALTATPARDAVGVQAIIDNLLVSRLEVKSEADIDIRPYVHTKLTEKKELKGAHTCVHLRHCYFSHRYSDFYLWKIAVVVLSLFFEVVDVITDMSLLLASQRRQCSV